ncbi:hypothetical protein QTH97_14110 [Variovorax sp. J22R24]|uniref:hypothetical protein n=1 Tax=Variovorax gracilis TaxID=3053502 RepID=UPI002578AEEB|nr:hypothetical protein [Variovorax sp. J22R24]MDM0106074.1 hypothetical protein [Variovorax sp. J22R24]
MTTRRTIVTSAAFLAPASVLRPALAQKEKEKEKGDAPKEADFLFVQTARSMTYDRTTGLLKLKAVSPVTVFFTDRPERIAGNMKTADFIPFWSKGKESFLSDPPNADISMVEGDSLHQVVAVLQSPVLRGDTLSYTIRVLKGKVPAKGAEVSVFIDVIGMPLTPLSYAGVARRSYRRAVIYR